MPVLGTGLWEGEDLAPQIAISVNHQDIDANIKELITEIEYDSSDNIANMMKLRVSNPEFMVTDQKVFQVGNIIKLWMGFTELTYIGAVIIEKVRPSFPKGDAMPTIDIVGYSAERLMMRNEPNSSDEKKPFLTLKEQEKLRKKQHKDKVRGIVPFKGRIWKDGLLYSNVIEEKANEYQFNHDVDVTPTNIVGPAGMIQKVGMSDYNLVAGIANELIWLFWVDMEEEDESWSLHFKDPDGFGGVQDKKFTFTYNSGSTTSLQEFDGEQLMGEGVTDLKVQLKNPKTGLLESISVIGDPSEEESVEFSGIIDDPIKKGGAPKNGAQLALGFGNVSVKVVADRQFQTPAQVREWAEKWYNENHRDFYSGKGEVVGPGAETLRAMQVHELQGLGEAWSGDYYFTNVNLKANAETGLVATFSGRKILGPSFSDYATATANIPELVEALNA